MLSSKLIPLWRAEQMIRRFFGLLCAADATIQKSYLTKDKASVFIQASRYGWTIIYDDYTVTFKDEDLCDVVNFEHAYKVAVATVGELRYLGDGILTEFEYDTSKED